MDILFLSHRIPFPPNKGDKIRSHAMITHLVKQGHRVHLACFVDDPHDMAHADRVRAMTGGECLFVPLTRVTKWLRAATAFLTGQPITTAYFGSAQLARWVGGLMQRRHIDRVIVYSTAMAPYVMRTRFEPSHVLFDMQDIDSDKWRQYASQSHGLLRWIFQREAVKLLSLERAAAKTFGFTTLVSAYEADSFMRMAPESSDRIGAIRHGVDLQHYSGDQFPNPFAPEEVAIVMTGRMDYRPNYEGAIWFAKEIMPHVVSRLPRARFHIVGAKPPKALCALASDRVVIAGQVDDIRPYIKHATVAVAPLKIARGVQNKILEAMAMARPVVATQDATRALGVTSGVDLWSENDAIAFAKAVVTAADPQRSRTVRQNGRRYVEQYHDWTRNLAALDAILTEAPISKETLAAKDAMSLSQSSSQERQRNQPSLAGAER